MAPAQRIAARRILFTMSALPPAGRPCRRLFEALGESVRPNGHPRQDIPAEFLTTRPRAVVPRKLHTIENQGSFSAAWDCLSNLARRLLNRTFTFPINLHLGRPRHDGRRRPPGPEWDVAPYLLWYGSFLDVLRRPLKPLTYVENIGAASVGGRMRPFEPEQAAQPTVSDRSADPLREALERNRELLAIVGSLPGAAYRYVRRADGTDALPFISERAMAVLGVSAGELRRNPKLLLEGFSVEARARLEAAMRQPPARLMPIDVEVEITPRAAPPRWVRFVARPSALGNGDVAWDRVILDADHDVRTRLSHELFATAVEHAADGIEITDPQFRLQYVNPAFERITGYSYQEVIGKTPGSLVRSGHFDAAYYEAIERTIKAGKLWRGELIARRKDGDLRYQEATISPVVDASGEILHFIAVKRDISEQKQREIAVIEAKDAAEQANRAKTTFLANMSHELRTPLNAIIGFAELIAMQVGGPIGSERYIGYARDIGASGEHLLKIINDVLDLTRIEAGGMELQDEPIRCADLIESSLRFVRDQAARANLAIAIDCAADLPRLRGDQRKLRQVLINLLSNAVKFTQRGGRVRVAAACASGGGLLLVVSDTGIGMASSDIARALTPFKQVDSSLARKHQGAGLGLALAKNLVELHDGALEVASELGQGTVVTCSFPAVRTIVDERPSEAAR